MIPHIHILLEFILSIPYENKHQTLNIKKTVRGQIKLREYSITLLQPKEKVCVTDNFFFLRILIPEDFPNKTVYDAMNFYRHFTTHDISKKFAHSEILTKMAYLTKLCYVQRLMKKKLFYLQIYNKSSYFKLTNFV